ncbi:MAG: 50S ribosomal protein L16 [Elusimicrobia bacterium]|nr:50S ribosomal protein L16 [Elusimicrobiota bacterium]
MRPKKVKYRKRHRGRRKGMALRGNKISFGEFGLKAIEPAWVTERQIEAARVAITRYMKRGGKVWIRIYPDHPVTKQPAETRMGKGKGDVEQYVAVVRPGRILFELEGLIVDEAKQAMRKAAAKMPMKCKFAVRGEYL